MSAKHEHDYKLTKKRILVHAYDAKGKIKGSSTGTDTLTQWVCACGKTITTDLKRATLIIREQ